MFFHHLIGSNKTRFPAKPTQTETYVEVLVEMIKSTVMKIKLHEIELGAADLQNIAAFYQSSLGLSLSVDQPQLKVFDSGVASLDLNFSHHLPQGNVIPGFLCDNLDEVMLLLKKNNVSFNGPVASHLGMISISFKDPAGYTVKINHATADSPEWLRKQW